ncbi:hypothetical protein B0J17DRAFT_677156 [Rhizoctonia solani]|nr:hypothetical protein B0J17DRAFT_677156 [Rhizoctonia solani]
MARRVQMIDHRLHSLLGVCMLWRNIGLACRALWFVVPVIDSFDGCPQPLSTDFSLQKAGCKALHLAISLSHGPHRKLMTLIDRLPQFTGINIDQKRHDAVPLPDILAIIIGHVRPQTLSNLCLEGRNAVDGAEEHRGYFAPGLLLFSNHCLSRFELYFFQLIKSLSILRVRGVDLDWGRMIFSRSLVVLRIAHISVGGAGVHYLISPLSSANNLRELELISIRAVIDEDNPRRLARKLIFPNLESLHLGDLNFNVMHSYRSTLDLTIELFTSFHTPDPEYSWGYQTKDNTSDDISELLRTAAVNELRLSMEEGRIWERSITLRDLLKSVPTVKNLILNDSQLDPDTLRALKQPPRPRRWAYTHGDIFPKLETLEFHCATIPSSLIALRTGFEDLLTSHPIKRMIIGKSYWGFKKTP